MLYTKYIVSLMNYLQFLIVWILKLYKKTNQYKFNDKFFKTNIYLVV